MWTEHEVEFNLVSPDVFREEMEEMSSSLEVVDEVGKEAPKGMEEFENRKLMLPCRF